MPQMRSGNSGEPETLDALHQGIQTVEDAPAEGLSLPRLRGLPCCEQSLVAWISVVFDVSKASSKASPGPWPCSKGKCRRTITRHAYTATSAFAFISFIPQPGACMWPGSKLHGLLEESRANYSSFKLYKQLFQAHTQESMLYTFTLQVIFPERPGALVRFLDAVCGTYNITLFHYRNTGNRESSVLMGLQVPPDQLEAFAAVKDGLQDTSEFSFKELESDVRQ
eukprot:scaffold188506_cov18-Tisochrysis_lutea.AAC.1